MEAQPNVMMAFACESATSDPGAPISFHNILDGIEAPGFPVPSARWFAVFCFYCPTEMVVPNCRVIIEHQSGEPVAQTKVKDLSFSSDRPISRNLVGFHGFAWPYPGWYYVKFMAERDTQLALFPMLVQHAAQAEEAEDENEDVEGSE